MSIKKRLFLSNMLMILIPLLLSVVILASTFLVIAGIIRLGPVKDSRRLEHFYLAVDHIDGLAAELNQTQDSRGLVSEIASFNKKYGDRFFASLYQNGNIIYRPENTPVSKAETAILTFTEGSIAAIGGYAAYTRNAGTYRIALIDTNYPAPGNPDSIGYQNYIITTSLLVIILFITTVVGTNLLLTRFVSKSIMGPLNALVLGVHEIRDGNLNYRIKYTRKDEFASVCDDFNEMAGHLQHMVNERLKDSENRKQLVAGISHDLRTPLTAIKAYVEGLEEGVASTPALKRRYFNTIKQKTDDLEHIVSQLFLFSKLDVGEFPFDLENIHIGQELMAFSNGVREEYRQKGLTIHQGAMADAYIKGDIVQLRTVFINILENSIKYADTNDACIHISASSTPEAVQLYFADNGPGVPEEMLPRLFDVFYRADAARTNPSKGSGLGLSIAAKVIEGLDGKIHAENAEGGGLNIVITFPAAKGGKNATHTNY